MKKVLTLVLLLLTLSFSLFPQENKQHTIHLPANGTSYQLLPINEYGVLCFSELESEYKNKASFWKFIKYDVGLEKNWELHYKISDKYKYATHTYENGFFYMIFYHNKSSDFRVMVLDIEEGQFSTYDINYGYQSKSYKLQIDEVKAIGKNLFLKGALLSSNALMHCHLDSAKLRVLETSFRGTPLIDHISENILKSTIEVTFLYKSHFNSAVQIKSYSYDGQQLEEYRVDPTDDKRLLNGQITKFSDREIYISGTFKVNKRKKKYGLYLAKLDGRDQLWIKFYKFQSLDHFPSTPDSLPKKTSPEYHVYPHKIIKQNGLLYLAGELYKPSYKRESDTYFDPSGIPVTKYYNIFQGWKFTHASYFSFSRKGDLLWHNFTPIKTFYSHYLKRSIVPNITGNKMLFHTVTPYGVSTSKIFNNTFEQGVDSVSSSITFDNTSKWDNGSQFWYDKFFISWKYIQIINENTQGYIKKYQIEKIDYTNYY